MNVLFVGCPTCEARIRASIRLIGRMRPCPRCGEKLVICPAPPEDSGPMILVDGKRPPVPAVKMAEPSPVPVSA
jgi:hypothetical protein